MWHELLQPLAKGFSASLLVSYLITLVVRVAAGMALYPYEVEIAVGLLVGAVCAWFWLWVNANPYNPADEELGRVVAVVVTAVVWIAETGFARLAGDGWVSAEFVLISSAVAQFVGIAVFKEAERPQPKAKVATFGGEFYSPEDIEVLKRNGKVH